MQRHTHTITQLSSDVNGQTCMAGQTGAALQERIKYCSTNLSILQEMKIQNAKHWHLCKMFLSFDQVLWKLSAKDTKNHGFE